MAFSNRQQSRNLIHKIKHGTSVDNALFLPWSLPTDGNKNVEELKTGPIAMDNGCTASITDKLELIVDFYHIPESVDVTMHMKWKRMMPKYSRNDMKEICQKMDFTDADIIEFQEQFDLFFQDWVGMYGLKAIMNYIHLLSSRQMSDYYLYKWQNLY
eukprot:scaffold490614_cov86-Attheya_sp.AAC.1